MHHLLRWRRSPALIAASIVVALAAGSVAFARTTSSGRPSTQRLRACVEPGNREVRIPPAGQACAGNEIPISWNERGRRGERGPRGPHGARGATGSTGQRGPAGAPGPMGAQGAKGDTGAIGPQGPQGAKGDTGPQGAQGDTGATGPQGAKGDTGAAGPQGQQGPAGTTGPAGPQGPTGPSNAQYNFANGVDVGGSFVNVSGGVTLDYSNSYTLTGTVTIQNATGSAEGFRCSFVPETGTGAESEFIVLPGDITSATVTDVIPKFGLATGPYSESLQCEQINTSGANTTMGGNIIATEVGSLTRG